MGMPVIRPSNTSRCQSVSDIIQSVALEQAALSHILNAEGEKIQKIVAESDSPEEMLSINKSVNNVVDSITLLEIVLKSKLALFEDCLCEECSCSVITSTALSFINLGDKTAEIIKTNNHSYTVLIEDGDELPISMQFSTTPAVPVAAVNLPAGVTFQNNIITITGAQADDGEIILEVGEGTCVQTVAIGIDIGPAGQA